MIVRLWHGWTTPENATEYERLVAEEVFPEIAREAGEGYEGYELGRRDHDETVEYVTITRFDSWEGLEAFAGEDYEQAHVPSNARALLAEFDERAHHYEVRDGDST
ncbi:antibiotic biosynthesis monooxygenase [Halobacteriales archaeon QS_3_64_16]|nr:MAG: antibiotic biosynthesis monooxygenase [Halobacteriales archaeon QS_3_64_16]